MNNNERNSSRVATPSFSEISSGIGSIILDLSHKQPPSNSKQKPTISLKKPSSRNHSRISSRNLSLKASIPTLKHILNSPSPFSASSTKLTNPSLRSSRSTQFSRPQPCFSPAQSFPKVNSKVSKLSISNFSGKKNAISANQYTENKHENHKLKALSRAYHDNYAEIAVSEKTLRNLIEFNSGLPLTEDDTENKKIRSIFWRVLLNIKSSNPEEYLTILKKCPSNSNNKINDDSFRTFYTDSKFRNSVSENVLKRILNAVICCGESDTLYPPRYVQGMNVLLAPFSYVLSEPSAFYTFKQFLSLRCPLYAKPNLPGVHAGSILVDECLAILDPQLFLHLYSHGIHGRIYAFPAVLSISANIPPLDELLKLWDYLLACGVYLNILCIVSQVLSLREILLISDSPKTILQDWPTLDAHFIIQSTRKLHAKIPTNVCDLLTKHMHDLDVTNMIISQDPKLCLVSQSLTLQENINQAIKDKHLLVGSKKTAKNDQHYQNQSNSQDADTLPNLARNESIQSISANPNKRKKMPTNLGISSFKTNLKSHTGRNRQQRKISSLRKNRILSDLQNFVLNIKDNEN